MTTKSKLEEQNKQLRERIAELEAAGKETTLPYGVSAPLGVVSLVEQSRKGKHYLFEVTPLQAKGGQNPALAPQRITAIDESEAIRLYCVSEANEAGKRFARRQPLDPSRHSFRAIAFNSKKRHADLMAQFDAAGTPQELRPAFAR